MKIVVLDAETVTSGDVSLDGLSRFGELCIYPLTDESLIAERLEKADIVLCNKTRLTAENMKNAANLKYIGLFATGYNNIDTDYTSSHGITVCNVPGYSTEAVAQHTFALILAILNRVGEYNATVKAGDWVKSRTFSYFPIPLSELCGKTIGIVGYGSIGKRVAGIANAFGMSVLVCNRHRITDGTVAQVSLDRLLKEADIVTLHCPLNSDSAGMMNASSFEKMKDGAVFINTARGPLVDEEALKNALVTGKLLGAGVDVLCSEPMKPDCPLLNVNNCFITPHIAWAGVETRLRLMKTVESNIDAFLHCSPQNTVV